MDKGKEISGQVGFPNSKNIGVILMTVPDLVEGLEVVDSSSQVFNLKIFVSQG